MPRWTHFSGVTLSSFQVLRIAPVFIVRYVDGNDPKMVVTDPGYCMICAVIYNPFGKKDLSEGRYGLNEQNIGDRFGTISYPSSRKTVPVTDAPQPSVSAPAARGAEAR